MASKKTFKGAFPPEIANNVLKYRLLQTQNLACKQALEHLTRPPYEAIRSIIRQTLEAFEMFVKDLQKALEIMF